MGSLIQGTGTPCSNPFLASFSTTRSGYPISQLGAVTTGLLSEFLWPVITGLYRNTASATRRQRQVTVLVSLAGSTDVHLQRGAQMLAAGLHWGKQQFDPKCPPPPTSICTAGDQGFWVLPCCFFSLVHHEKHCKTLIFLLIMDKFEWLNPWSFARDENSWWIPEANLLTSIIFFAGVPLLSKTRNIPVSEFGFIKNKKLLSH